MLKDYVLKENDYIVGLRRFFHTFPERSLQEYKTAEKIIQELEKLDIEYERVGATGVAGYINKGKHDRKIALRADIDALPVLEKNEVSYKSQNEGCMHACGHDSHAASLLGAAKILKSKENELDCEVRLFFQQAEEIGQGAREFIKKGLLEGVEVILGCHVNPQIPVGTVALVKGPIGASCDYFKITVQGKSAHVSTPHLGIDALYTASQIVVALQSIVSRQTNPIDTVVVGTGVIKGGTGYNIIAGEAVLEGTTRTFTRERREQTNSAVINIAKSVAETYGASADVFFESYSAPLINDAAATDMAITVAKGFAENIVTDFPKSLGADDFADFGEHIPAIYARVGTRNDNNPATAKPLHNDLFDIDEAGMLYAANLYVDFVLSKVKL